jgi:hypothetical protein
VAEKFTAENAQVVMLSWADACFLQAEAALYLGLSDADAQKYYENGIKASFAQHGVTAADSISAYLAQPGIAWRTDGIGYSDNRQLYRASIMGASGQKDLNGVEINEGALDQIYKQRWMADFFNGLEGWNLERRTRAMNFLPFFNAGRSTDVEGVNASYNYWTERYIFPRSELNNNKASYYDAIVKLQENSDYTQPFNEGNNVFTSLGFAKKIPDIESANQRFGQSRQMKNHCEYFSHYYGATYEKMEEVFIKASGRTSVNMITRPLAINEGKLKLCYEETRLLFWYKTADYPVTPAP